MAQSQKMKKISQLQHLNPKFTKAEQRYISLISEGACVSAYHRHMDGEGGSTVGERFWPKDMPTPRTYTSFGDCIINAGRKLVSSLS